MLASDDTIAAIGSAAGGAARGMVRVAGPRAIDVVAGVFTPIDASAALAEVRAASVVPGSIRLASEPPLTLDCDLFVWPNERSYTREPLVELHLLGSPPLLHAVLDEVCRQGARLAGPGEFTLRAFLAGRIDLTQAEAVLGVIDARGDADLKTALRQLAGGLSGPLDQLRDRLLDLLAHLEAGLDFAEEDIEFITAEELAGQLA
ncbi:MAG: tRNA uridine-5-carboxymethylaminomethyl(34) synthesis GTPase MnmE, partial [Pirellulales bacterium]